MKILLADDHAVVRRGLKEILLQEFKNAVFAEARSVPEVLTLAQKQAWDIVVLDISMPGRGGMEALRELKSACPRLPVIMFSVYPEEQFAVRALKAGAAGYVTKQTAPEELTRAIRKVLAGGRYVSASLAEKLAGELSAGVSERPHETLSDREYQVLQMIGAGKTVKEIAGELCLSVKTISTYRARILEKMGRKTTAELIRYAIENRLAE